MKAGTELDRSSEAVKARYDKAVALIAGGMPRNKAYLEARIGPDTFGKIRKGKHPAAGGAIVTKGPRAAYGSKTKRRFKKPKFVDLAPIVTADDSLGDEHQIAVVLCKPNQLKEILGRIK